MPTHAQHTDTSQKLPAMSGPEYDPKVGDQITVQLPDERTRCTIKSVISPVACVAELNHFTTSKSHNFRKGDLIPCRYEMLEMNQLGWRSLTDRELAEAEARGKKKKA